MIDPYERAWQALEAEIQQWFDESIDEDEGTTDEEL